MQKALQPMLGLRANIKALTNRLLESRANRELCRNGNAYESVESDTADIKKLPCRSTKLLNKLSNCQIPADRSRGF